MLGLFDEFWVGISHLLHQRRGEFMNERLVQAEGPPVARGPAQDAAQDVAPPLVGGEDAVGDAEGEHPDVVGDHPDGDAVLVVVGPPGEVADR